MKTKKPKLPKRRSALEGEFEWQLLASGMIWTTEYRFDPKRKWRCDFFIQTDLGQQPIIVEIEGGIKETKRGTVAFGRHTRGDGFEADIEKYNEISLRGYILLRGTAKHVKSGELLKWVERALGNKN